MIRINVSAINKVDIEIRLGVKYNFKSLIILKFIGISNQFDRLFHKLWRALLNLFSVCSVFFSVQWRSKYISREKPGLQSFHL